MRTSLPLTKEHFKAPGLVSTWRSCTSWAVWADRDTEMTHMQHPNVVMADTQGILGNEPSRTAPSPKNPRITFTRPFLGGT